MSNGFLFCWFWIRKSDEYEIFGERVHNTKFDRDHPLDSSQYTYITRAIRFFSWKIYENISVFPEKTFSSSMQSLLISSLSDADQRIDKFLRKYLPHMPLAGIFRWIRTGKVKVNGEKIEQNYRLVLGDTIEFSISDDEWNILKQEPPKKVCQYPWESDKSLDILYEDDFLIVINKPAGVNVHPWDHKSSEVSLIERVHDYLGTQYHTLSFRPSLVHRIDRDTSGCVMIAKEKHTLRGLLDLLQSGRITKIYHTIVVGTPEKPRDTLRMRLLRIENAKNEAKVRVDSWGQEAVTRYQILDAHICDIYSLIECVIETWRTHQIRVHLASIGHPILGDSVYGNRGENSFVRRKFGVERQLLHARSLTFLHPMTHEKIHVEAAYPHDFSFLLSQKGDRVY